MGVRVSSQPSHLGLRRGSAERTELSNRSQVCPRRGLAHSRPDTCRLLVLTVGTDGP